MENTVVRNVLITGLIVIALAASATSSGVVDEGTRQLSSYSVAYEGPELEESRADIPFHLEVDG